VRPDLCAVDNPVHPRTYLGRFWVDSLVHDPRSLDLVLDVCGRDRVMLGSDYPFPLGEDHPGEIVEKHPSMDDDTREAILGRNALEFLGVSIERFL
jgi:aminocarboxymuconate-semialdehyde decarboxylase